MIIRYFDLPTDIAFGPDIRVAYGSGEFTDYIRLGKNPLVVTVNSHRKGYLFSDHSYQQIKKLLGESSSAVEALTKKGAEWLKNNITQDVATFFMSDERWKIPLKVMADAMKYAADVIESIFMGPGGIWVYQDEWDSVFYQGEYYDINVYIDDMMKEKDIFRLSFTLYATGPDGERYVTNNGDIYSTYFVHDIQIQDLPLYNRSVDDILSK